MNPIQTRTQPIHNIRHTACRALPCPAVLFLALFILNTSMVSAEPAFGPPDPDVIQFGSETAELQSVGLKLGLPVGSKSTIQTIGGRITVGVILPDQLGSVLMQVRDTAGKKRSVLDMERAVLRRTLYRTLSDERLDRVIDFQFETQAGVSLGRSLAIPCAGRIVRPFYVFLSDDSPEPMRGFGVIPIDIDRFVFFQLACSSTTFERSRQVFELMLGSATIAETEKIDTERGSLIAAGAKALAALSESNYSSIISDIPDGFERIYRPATQSPPADEQEVGYRRVRAWIGSIEDIETGKPDPEGPANGYLLRIDGSVLLDDGLGSTNRADSRAVYYLSMDRNQESWKVDMSVHSEGRTEPEVWSEIGMRVGNSMSVQVTNSKRESSTLRPSIGEAGYISRLEAAILPKLLIHAGNPGDFAFYAYDQTAEVNRLRTVNLNRDHDRPGIWMIKTDISENQSEQAEFNNYGRLIRSETSKGLLKRPIEFDRLYKIWNAKGLPLD